jgi:hypothetical protein
MSPEDVRLIWLGADEFWLLCQFVPVRIRKCRERMLPREDRAVGDVLEGYAAAVREAA